MKHFIFLFTSLFILSGCVDKQPHVSEYVLQKQLQIPQAKQTQCFEKSLKVARSYGSSLYMKEDMLYGVNQYQIETFTKSKWAIAPAKAINAQIVDMLREMKLFSTVHSSKSLSYSDYILESNVDEFLQYFSQDDSYVKVTVSFALIDHKNVKTVAAKSFSAQVNVDELNAKGGVEALNKALDEILLEVSKWLGEVCV